MKRVPKWARADVFARAAGACDRCGVPTTEETGHFHHRKLRSRGGSHSPENCVALCPACHRWVHENVAAATRTGWIVNSWAVPDDEPVVTLWDAVLLPGRSRWLGMNEVED